MLEIKPYHTVKKKGELKLFFNLNLGMYDVRKYIDFYLETEPHYKLWKFYKTKFNIVCHCILKNN